VDVQIPAEFFLEDTASPSLGIEEEILLVSGLLASEMDISLDQEIDLPGELVSIDVLDSSFYPELYEGMDLSTIRELERLIEDLTPKGVERG
jgi:hypothetical protein